jgi:hypothetical protein
MRALTNSQRAALLWCDPKGSWKTEPGYLISPGCFSLEKYQRFPPLIEIERGQFDKSGHPSSGAAVRFRFRLTEAGIAKRAEIEPCKS